MPTQINDDLHNGAVGVETRPSAKCCVNVRDFGAVGQALSTKGSIQAGSKVLRVHTLDGWVQNAGIGIAGASAGLTPARPASLVTRVVSIDPINKTLLLKDAAENTVADVTVSSNDSLPIQDAIDSLGKRGGTVCLPPGTYMIGTPEALTNQPIVLGSNVRVLGAGRGASILQLCQEANVLWQGQKATPLTGLRMAGPIFMNASNYWWSNTQMTAAQLLMPFYGLPYDSNIEIAGITFDGDKNHQTHVYEPDYRPNPTGMPKPTTSVQLNGTTGGRLPVGTYWVFIRFQDAGGNEGIGGAHFKPLSLGPPDNAIAVSLPPVFPEGAVAVVPYICRNDGTTTANSINNELDPDGNPRYERFDPILLSSILPWDGNLESPWPTIPITSHTAYPQAPAFDPQVPVVDTQGNYPVTGIVNFNGNTGDQCFGTFINAKNLYVHDIEIRNFVNDGFNLEHVTYSQFDRIHSHNNGRHGLSITTDQIEEVDFNDCVFESNASSGVDMEPIEGKSLRWHCCSFLRNHEFGVAFQVFAECRDLEFDACLFDGNTWHLQNSGGGNITNLKINDCRFRNNDGNCIVIGGQNIAGEISGCDFDQANGRVPQFGPRYDLYARDVPAILLSGSTTVFRITNNHFKPWAAGQNFVSSAYMIDISATAGGHTIQNNHFESNPDDKRSLARPIELTGAAEVKNQNFLLYYLNGPGPLSSNKIAGNIGDGLIWTGLEKIGSEPEPGAIFACGLDLEEKGIQSVAQGKLSIPISFVRALPAPPLGNYLVTAAFNWNAGAWWAVPVPMTAPYIQPPGPGFTITWENPAPAASASLAPQITWTAKFIA